MPTSKELYETALDQLTDVINQKAGTTGKKNIPQLKQTADTIKSIEDGTIPVKTAADLTVSGKTVTVPVGYYGEQATKDVADGSATTPSTSITANPSIAVNQQTGEISSTVSKTESVTPSVTPGYVASGTAGNVSVSGSATEQLSVQAAQTITPTTSDQTIPAGKYLTGAQTVKGDANLVPGNIKKDITLFGITGTLDNEESTYEDVLSDAYGSGATPVPSNFKYVEVNPLNVNQNGTYNAPANSAYDPVGVFVPAGGEQPQLNAPTISASGNVITISNPATNGNFVTGYKIFLDGIYSTTVSTTTATITDLGSHAVTVKAIGTDFEDSAASNSVTIANYTITVSTTHCTASQSNPTTITNNGGTATLVFTADTDYEVRASGVIVTNATVVSVDKDTGTVVIGTPTGNVTLTVVGEVPQSAAILTVTGLGNYDPSSVSFTESGSIFDWNALTEETIDGNVFIKIPTIYRKIESVSGGRQITSFSLSNQQIDNTYEPYPCFVHKNNILPYILIGKYCSSSTSIINSINASYAPQTIENGRTKARSLGIGYQLYDWQLQKLFVDLAMMKAKKVDFNNGNVLIDEYLSIAHLDNSVWIDGCYKFNDVWHFALDPDDYISSPSPDVQPDGYSSPNYSAPTSSNEVKSLGFDGNNPFFNYPSEIVTNSNMNTYYCDRYGYSSGSNPVSSRVGYSVNTDGLWGMYVGSSWPDNRAVRLCYRPISA